MAATLTLSVAFTVFSGAPASADIPWCMGTYYIQANNGMYVSNREDEGNMIKAVVPGGALGTWERFRLFRHALDPNGNRAFAIRASNNNWVLAEPFAGQLWANYVVNPKDFPHGQTFKFNGTSDGPSGGFQPIKALVNGWWVTNEEAMGGLVRANRGSVGAWEQFKWIQLNTSCLPGS